MVDQAFQELLDEYMRSKHRKKVDIITKAYHFARQAHKGVKRLSGEPYILHPIAVAMIACKEVGLGSTSICAALLHDVVEDTDYTVEDIENMFGAKIAQIVDGLTKISGGIFGEQASAQAENFEKLLLTMSDDIRVILIKICDRLHNMRTLESQPANKQYKIAGETLYIYAPLANRLGLYKIKGELENLSFRFEHPEEYEAIVKKLEATQAKRHELFDQFTKPIEEALDQMGIDYHIKERVKSPYSIWSKMQRKQVTFEEVYDILAARIVFTPKKRDEEVNECFNIYVAISKIYKSHPDRLRDWLNHPKANGYQALHVTLMSKSGQWIEVQIRSDRMDEIAEQGFAAHWKYKEQTTADAENGDAEPGEGEITENESELNEWLHTIKEILDDPQPDAMDFLDAIKLNLFASEIFVFTPKGEIKTMPAGCTALDFAFSIHSFLGSHCIGAKVNHKLVPFSHQLHSGDQVEILTSKSQQPQPDWINYVSTAKAKGKIQALLRRYSREQQAQGEKMLKAFVAQQGMSYTPDMADVVCNLHDMPKREMLYEAIARKTVLLGQEDADAISGRLKKKSTGQGWRKYVPFIKSKKDETEEQQLLVVSDKLNRKKPVYITDANIGQYKFMHCCHPIPGDDALGYIDARNQIEIHRRDCPVAMRLKAAHGNRILDAKWDMQRTLFFDATIRLGGIDRMGLVNEVTSVISSQMGVNIHRLEFTSEDGVFDGRIELRVHDRADVAQVMKQLKQVENLKELSQIL
ncbi:MAG: RelA/SpoT family protein [Prevotella sp.]|nr:RelA/SpoT family protein [Prevotella sp.]